MRGQRIEHYGDETVTLQKALQDKIPPEFRTFYNGSGSDIAAKTPVDLDLSVTTYGAGLAMKAAAGGLLMGAVDVVVPNGTWGSVQIKGPQVDVITLNVGAAGMGFVGSGTASLIGGSARRVARGSIAAAAVRTLNATPVELIAAQAGMAHIVERILWRLDFGTIAYDAAAAGDTLAAHYTNGSGAAVVDAVAGNAIGSAAADYMTEVLAVPEVIPVVNAAIVAALQAGEWYAAAGDSVLRYEIIYRTRVVTLESLTTITAGGRDEPAGIYLTAPAAGVATVLWNNPLGL